MALSGLDENEGCEETLRDLYSQSLTLLLAQVSWELRDLRLISISGPATG
jgi:hypothetical protein